MFLFFIPLFNPRFRSKQHDLPEKFIQAKTRRNNKRTSSPLFLINVTDINPENHFYNKSPVRRDLTVKSLAHVEVLSALKS